MSDHEGIRRVKLWLRDTLSYDPALILSGRQNFERDDFEKDYITVDALGAAQLKSSSRDYDDEAEVMKISLLYSFPATINFYGPNAHARAMKMQALRLSQESHTAQREHEIVIHAPESTTDAKALTGQQYGERIEVVLNAEYLHTESVDRLRIDTANLQTPLEDVV